MKEIIKSLVAALCLVVLPGILAYSEGTRQIMPTANAGGQLCINKYRNDFAFYDGSPDFRLNISVADLSEVIRFGFGNVLSSDPSVLYYRLKEPGGAVVAGSVPVPSAGKGHISSYTEAVTGPFPGGYDYLEYQPATTGNYYLEFYYSNVNSDNNRHYLEFFDITVVNAATNPVEGRLWSKAWQFWSPGNGTTDNDRFYGKMMVLSDDSIVTQVDCNGFRGGSFSFSSNMTGCSTTGNLFNDRMSTTGFNTYPQYKVFLNNPDSNLYPTQTVTSGIILPVTVTTNCTTGGAEFGIIVEKDETIKLLIQVNPSPGADPQDVQIIANVKANPGGTGYNYITWDGLDNFGKPVANATSLDFSVTNLSGLTHLPIYDIENNDYGFIVSQVRPPGGKLKIYWDDSRIPGGTPNSSAGCVSTNGCHTWNNDFGNNNTINSWWFVSGTEISSTPFITKKLSGTVSLTGNVAHCEGTTDSLVFSIAAEPNSSSYAWTYSGTGVKIDASELTAKLVFSPASTPGAISVRGHNDICGNGPLSSLPVPFEPLPNVTIIAYPDICYTATGFGLTGGKPEGGTYFVDGAKSDSIYPYKMPEGVYAISYFYSSPVGCSNSDSTSVLLFNSPDCEGTIFFPDAFSPNSDSVNDNFRPVVKNIFSFTMHIYNRWGQLMYSTQDVNKGWDGKYQGVQCPTGSYSYEAVYTLSLRTDEYKTKKGMFTLIR